MKAVIVLIMMFQLSMPVCAAQPDIGVEELEKAVPAPAEEIYGELEADAEFWDEGLSRLADWIGENLLPELRRALKSGGQMIAILVLCSAAESISGGKVPDFVPLGGALGIAAVAAGDVKSFIGLGESALRSLTDFAALLLPCIAAAGAAAGSLNSSAAMYAATMLFMDILLGLCSGLIMPLIHIYIAAVTARAALGSEVLTTAVNITKWLCVSAMTVLVTVFTAYFSITGAIGGAADAAAAKLAKTAIAAALPVVGKIVSGAADSVAAGAQLLRSGVGVLGMLSVLAVCAWPFLALGVHYAVYKAVAMVSGGLTGSRLGGLIGGIGTAFGMVLALVGCGALMLFFAIVSGMKAVSPL